MLECGVSGDAALVWLEQGDNRKPCKREGQPLSFLPLPKGVRLPPANQGFSPTQDLRTGAPRLWLTSWTSLGQVSTEGHKSRFRCFSSLHYVCMFQPGLYRSSASFWLVFSENCSTCRCIFDVFTEGDELHTLLLCHRGLNSGKYTFLIYKVKVIIPFLTDYQYNKQCKEAMYLKYTVSFPYTASAIIANVVITIIIETT